MARPAAAPRNAAATAAAAPAPTSREIVRRRFGTVPSTTGTAGTVPSTTGTAGTVSVTLPPFPVRRGRSFAVSPDSIATSAAGYVADGGDPADPARFFFGNLAVSSLDDLAGAHVTPDLVRNRLGNLAVSGYFGGIWLRDNLRAAGATNQPMTPSQTPAADLAVSAFGIHLFDALAGGLTAAASSPSPWLVTAAAHATVPVLLALYGYNRGYLQVILDNPPPGAPSMQNTLSCSGFLDCNSSAFPLQIATRYDGVLAKLAAPSTPGWAEMALWSTVLESATNAGRFVWERIAAAGAFSPASYSALVDLSSAYLMVSKAAVLSAMSAAADGDVALGRSSLLLQAGLWMWSGSYFGGLASGASRGTIPSITVSA